MSEARARARGVDVALGERGVGSTSIDRWMRAPDARSTCVHARANLRGMGDGWANAFHFGARRVLRVETVLCERLSERR